MMAVRPCSVSPVVILAVAMLGPLAEARVVPAEALAVGVVTGGAVLVILLEERRLELRLKERWLAGVLRQ